MHDAVFPSSGCFLKSSIDDSATSVRAKPEPGPTEIIRQRLPIYDKTYFIEAQKKTITFITFFEQKDFVCKTSQTEIC